MELIFTEKSVSLVASKGKREALLRIQNLLESPAERVAKNPREKIVRHS